MAGSSLLTLLDDITTLLDDVATMTKVATQKTVGVLGDDLALNAEQVTGIDASRELPVVWAVCKGSLINKAILVPAALVISAFVPWGIAPLLICGGLFLCFEGVEKLAHKRLHSKAEIAEHDAEIEHALVDPAVDLVAFERDKIKGAVRTDFILSAEIIVITLGIVATETFAVRVGVLAVIAVAMTLGVYGLVAGIVKLDDIGLHLSRKPKPRTQAIGRFLVRAAPYLMKFLSVAGTVAMFLVGGGIVAHGIPPVHHAIEWLGEWGTGVHAVIGTLLTMLANAGIGVAAGIVVLGLVSLAKLARRKLARRVPAGPAGPAAPAE